MDFSEEFEYTEELEEFAKEVRQWMDENAPKDLGSGFSENVGYEQWQNQCDFRRKLGKKGWLYPGHHQKYGGGGLDRDHRVVIARELAKRNSGFLALQGPGGALGVPAILACGTEEQKERHLTPILKGEVYTWESFSEPEAGTDEANQQTKALRAERENDYFIINGQKMFSSGPYPPPDQFLLLTRSDLKAPRHQNLAMFICPANLPGISISPMDLFVPVATNQIFFDDVRLHESYLIGGDHDGWKVVSATLDAEHGVVRSSTVSGQRRKRNVSIPRNLTAERFIAQCKNNPNIVKRLRENPHLLGILVDTYIGAEIERLLKIRNHGGKAGLYGGPQQLIYSKMFAAKLAANMEEILGPYVLTDDAEWCLDEGIFEAGQRGAMAFAPGGTPEAQKIIISRALAIGR